MPAKADAAGIEPPAKHINIVSEPIPMPMAAGEISEEKPEDAPEDGEKQQTQE